TTVGTITDIDGKFTLSNVPSSAKTLQISYIGMMTQEVGIKSYVKVSLKPDNEMLDEVVVTGYGNFKKSSFTGAASSITTEKLQDIPSLSVQDKLAGAVAGVQVTSTSGQPGAVESVRIRGMGSINAGNNPLYVIDGVPVMVGNASGFSYSDAGNSLLSTINSNDIESMTVIKDAAAASLYGSRAANGVIVITTKKGASGKMKINLRADWGFSNRAIDYRPTLNGEDRRELLHLGLVNYAKNSGDSEAEAQAYADSKIDGFAAKPKNGYTDWESILFKNGSHQNYEVNAQGGSEKTKFYTSLGYTKQEGITLNSGYERITGRANLTHKADRVTLEASTMFTSSNQNVNSEGTSFSSPIMCVAMTASPSTYPYNEDGTFSNVFPALNGANPLQTATYNYDRSGIIRTMNSLSATWNVWDNLNLKETLGYDFNQTNNRVWWDPRSNDGRSSKGVFQRYMMNRSKLNTQTQLSYVKTFNRHNIDFLLGFETEDYKYDYTYTNGNTYPSFLPEITNAGVSKGSSNIQSYRMTSYLGRLNYDFSGRYYASASFRRDGSSRLARESRWGDFWSVSGSWRLSQEKFMESVSDIITDAKIRASYGVNGTQPADYYGYMGVYEFGYNYNGSGGSAEARFYNPQLKWEKNYATNIGIDVTLFNRLSISAEWYNRDTKDLLMDKPISAAIGVIDSDGVSNMLVNVGSMRNRGFELEIKSTNIQNKELLWTTALNVGHNNNTLTKLDGEQQEVISGVMINRVGEPYYSIYAYEYAGVDPKTGKESYYINGEDGSRETTTVSSKANKTIIGSIQPTLQGGLTNYISWKFIDFNFTLTYSLGGHVYDRASWLQSNGGTYHYLGNIPSYYKIEDTWQKEGDNAKLPQFAYGNRNIASSRWLLSTDHLRLKNMSLGFTLPAKWSEKAGINKLRAYVSGNNLLTWKAKGMYIDPEVPANGLSTFETPALRTVTFGFEIGF
ncbi:TonB-dependent receptor, partial [Bacteroides sp.]|uniref:SusC/RagA family TonB-linked outer membrane protein n=1 Tax=Bacteroides sp. TaxID=29523 RepID=UPI002FC68190